MRRRAYAAIVCAGSELQGRRVVCERLFVERQRIQGQRVQGQRGGQQRFRREDREQRLWKRIEDGLRRELRQPGYVYARGVELDEFLS